VAIKIWQSYSCNNSSSYRLVARFSDATTAQAAASDLDAFFKAYAVEMDAIVEANDYTWPDRWPPGAVEFASKYGISLDRDALGWGDEGLTGDEPELVVEDRTLLVYHSYSGGFGKAVPAYLSARGATEVEREETGSPTLTVLVSYAGGNKKLDGELKKLAAQIDNERSPSRQVDELETPWKSRSRYGEAAFYRDAKTVGMVLPFVPRDLVNLRGWFTKHGLDASIRLCEPADATELAACAGATCEACGGVLELWHPRLRDVETAQMVCGSCGGMYEMSTMVAAATKRRRARERAERKAAEQAAAASKKQPTATRKPTKKPATKKPATKKPATKKPTKRSKPAK
jgi:hypothetical protein